MHRAPAASARGGANARGRLGKHFEGWQPGVVAVGIAGLVAALVVPRSVAPNELPMPALHPEDLAAARALDERRADLAEAEPLDVDVRALGSAIRAYGRADDEGNESEAVAAKTEVVRAALSAHVDVESLLRLRAFQLERFLAGLRRWEATGERSDDFVELGGGFPRMVAQSRWCEGTPCRRLLLNEDARRATFKKRWNEIVGTQREALALSLDEQRALYAFFFQHPVPLRGSAEQLDGAALLHQKNQFLLRKIDDFASVDGSYPASFARGVVLFRMGRYPLAVEAFRRHLDGHADGPWALRAQNHLRAALELSRDPSGSEDGHSDPH